MAITVKNKKIVDMSSGRRPVSYDNYIGKALSTVGERIDTKNKEEKAKLESQTNRLRDPAIKYYTDKAKNENNFEALSSPSKFISYIKNNKDKAGLDNKHFSSLVDKIQKDTLIWGAGNFKIGRDTAKSKVLSEAHSGYKSEDIDKINKSVKDGSFSKLIDASYEKSFGQLSNMFNDKEAKNIKAEIAVRSLRSTIRSVESGQTKYTQLLSMVDDMETKGFIGNDKARLIRANLSKVMEERISNTNINLKKEATVAELRFVKESKRFNNNIDRARKDGRISSDEADSLRIHLNRVRYGDFNNSQIVTLQNRFSEVKAEFEKDYLSDIEEKRLVGGFNYSDAESEALDLFNKGLISPRSYEYVSELGRLKDSLISNSASEIERMGKGTSKIVFDSGVKELFRKDVIRSVQDYKGVAEIIGKDPDKSSTMAEQEASGFLPQISMLGVLNKQYSFGYTNKDFYRIITKGLNKQEAHQWRGMLRGTLGIQPPSRGRVLQVYLHYFINRADRYGGK